MYLDFLKRHIIWNGECTPLNMTSFLTLQIVQAPKMKKELVLVA